MVMIAGDTKEKIKYKNRMINFAESAHSVKIKYIKSLVNPLHGSKIHSKTAVVPLKDFLQTTPAFQLLLSNLYWRTKNAN